jgi:uncharacterized protein (TIGR02646 family)
MIRIVKPVKPPKILTTKGVEQTQKDCAAYDSNTVAYRSGTKKFLFDGKIWGRNVKKALMLAQHNKCCYCESKLPPTSYGDVEHYRPKGAVRQIAGQHEEHPGYYWLAYDWNNLLVSCAFCNTRHKRNLFPLVDNNARVRSHHDNIDSEQPLLVNPAIEDPRDHIYFRGDAPVPRTEIGRLTIQLLGLRNTNLDEARRKCPDELQTYQAIIEKAKHSDDPEWQPLKEKALQKLAAAVRPDAEYSAMAQDFINACTSFSSDILPNGD